MRGRGATKNSAKSSRLVLEHVSDHVSERFTTRFGFIYLMKLEFFLQLWYALSKTVSEQAAWALAMDRNLDMVSINNGLVLGPGVAQQNPDATMAYLKGKVDKLCIRVLSCVSIRLSHDIYQT